jgi:glyoxylase-like metal-dependent hydrolase (beta-lactamase superfamily II)
MTQEFGVPVVLHPADASRQEARRSGVEFSDPLGSETLSEAGMEMVQFPGHTEGSIMLYSGNHGGFLLAGDSAVGPGPRQEQDPPRLIRPPATTGETEEGVKERWRAFGKPLRTICSLQRGVRGPTT